MFQIDANANSHANVDTRVNGPLLWKFCFNISHVSLRNFVTFLHFAKPRNNVFTLGNGIYVFNKEKLKL